MSATISNNSESHLSPTSSMSHLLHTAEEELWDVALGRRTSTDLNQDEVNSLEQDVLETPYLLRPTRNVLAPINKIPPEVLILIPNSWEMYDRNRDIIALTHVCRAWREIFTSRSSLWTDFECMDVDQTRVYLERSNSSPINVSIDRSDHGLSPCDPFLQIFPHATGRLKSLTVGVELEYLRDITAHLSLPAPLLEDLSVHGGIGHLPQHNPTLTSTLFDGDLSSLRELCLQSVHTKLPWRNMVNLTSFTFAYTSPGEVSIGQFLDFLESAPRLRQVQLRSATPTFGAQNGRRVSLACLKKMDILGGRPSLLLDHLLIPVGTELITHATFPGSLIEDLLPRSLDNLRNLSNFTGIRLYAAGRYTPVEFSGPNGQVTATWTDTTHFVLEYLPRLDTSKAERLEIDCNETLSRDFAYQTLLLLASLRTLAFSHCQSLYKFIDTLRPSASSSEVVACPKLEELVLAFHINEGMFDMKDVIEMAAARASRGVGLKSIRIVSNDKVMRTDVLELKKYVLHVECRTDVGEVGDEED